MMNTETNEGKNMNMPANLISVPELRRMLYTIADNNLDTCFRYRLLGEMWQPNFFRVVEVSEKGLVLNDEIVDTFKCLTDLTQIMQFEIDVALHNFLPHNHYDVQYCERSDFALDLARKHF